MSCHLGIARWSLVPVPGGLLVSYKGLDAEVGEPVPRCANQRGSWKRQNPGVHDAPCPDPSYRVPAACRSNSGNCPSNCVRGRNRHRGKGREPDRCRRRQFCGKSANRPKVGSYPRPHGFYDSPSSEHRSDRHCCVTTQDDPHREFMFHPQNTGLSHPQDAALGDGASYRCTSKLQRSGGCEVFGRKVRELNPIEILPLGTLRHITGSLKSNEQDCTATVMYSQAIPVQKSRSGKLLFDSTRIVGPNSGVLRK